MYLCPGLSCLQLTSSEAVLGKELGVGRKELMLLNCGAGEDSWESFGLQGDQTSNPKGNQPWIFIGRTDAEAEVPICCHLMWFIGKNPDAGKDWGQKKRAAEDEMVKWLDSITKSMEMNLSKLWEIVKDSIAWRATVRGVAKNQTWLRDWTKFLAGRKMIVKIHL